jgi:hypothetical protein
MLTTFDRPRAQICLPGDGKSSCSPTPLDHEEAGFDQSHAASP